MKTFKLTLLLTLLFSFSTQELVSQCTFTIPATAKTGTTGFSFHRWICDGDTYFNNGLGSLTYYMESGSIVNSVGGGSNTFYVKEDATLNISGGGGSISIYFEPGAIINNTLSGGGGNVVISCSDIDFDYSNTSNIANACNFESPPPVHPILELPHDSNDKLVLPVGCGILGGMLEDSLTYLIRFQNLGQSVVNDVVVEDYLDANLDMKTFKLIQTSHPVSNQTVVGNFVRIEFWNTSLQPSGTNLEESKGYVIFRIDPLPLQEGATVVENQATILFDNNPPIITQTILNTIFMDQLSLDNACNPSSGECNVACGPGKVLICHPHAKAGKSSKGAKGSKSGKANKSNHNSFKTKCIKLKDLDKHLSHGAVCGPCASNKQRIRMSGIDLQINVYPNPTNENLTISMDGIPADQAVHLQLIGLRGEMIFEEEYLEADELIQWNLSQLSSGIYIMKVRFGSQLIVKKIVKN